MEAQHRNIMISVICGALFGFSWWMMIDILAVYPEVNKYKHGIVYLPILLSTSSLFINSFIPNSSLVDNFMVTKTVFLHRLVFFFSMTLAFGGLLSSVLICVLRDAASLPLYAVIGIPFLNGLILIANVIFKFALVDENEDFY